MISHPLRTREAPRELLPKLPPSRGSSQSALAGTPVSKRPCEHSDPMPGRSPVSVRSDAESPKAPRRGTLAGSAAAPCGVRRERHDEPLPTRRGLRDCSCSTHECRGSRRRRQPPGQPGFRAPGLLFARSVHGAKPPTGLRGRPPGRAGEWGRGSRGSSNAQKGRGTAGWPPISETPRKPWPEPQPPRGLNPSLGRPFGNALASSRREGLAPLSASRHPQPRFGCRPGGDRAVSSSPPDRPPCGGGPPVPPLRALACLERR
jgi:hypothetical protein